MTAQVWIIGGYGDVGRKLAGMLDRIAGFPSSSRAGMAARPTPRRPRSGRRSVVWVLMSHMPMPKNCRLRLTSTLSKRHLPISLQRWFPGERA